MRSARVLSEDTRTVKKKNKHEKNISKRQLALTLQADKILSLSVFTALVLSLALMFKIV